MPRLYRRDTPWCHQMTTGLDARDPFPARSFEQPSRQEAFAWWPADQTSRREDRNVTSARGRQSLAEAVSFRDQRHKSSMCRAAPARWHTWALARSRWIRRLTCVTTNNSDGHDSPPEADDRIVRPRHSEIRELSNRTRACRSSRARLPLRHREAQGCFSRLRRPPAPGVRAHREHVAQPRAPDEGACDGARACALLDDAVACHLPPAGRRFRSAAGDRERRRWQAGADYPSHSAGPARHSREGTPRNPFSISTRSVRASPRI